jgi:hypothetical protein
MTQAKVARSADRSPGPGDPVSAQNPGLEDVDAARIGAMCATLRLSSTEGLLAEVFAGVDGAAALVESISRHCTFDHGALLVFPDRFEDAMAALPALGANPGSVVQSVIVKSRLSERYGIDPADLDVRLTHATLAGPADAGRKIEIFMLRRSPELPASLIDRERALELERHVALRLLEPDPIVVQGLRWVLREHAGFAWDGGGYNPHDNAPAGGTSVLYFLGWTEDPAGGAPRRNRLEVKFHGDYSYITSTHVDAALAPARTTPANAQPAAAPRAR